MRCAFGPDPANVLFKVVGREFLDVLKASKELERLLRAMGQDDFRLMPAVPSRLFQPPGQPGILEMNNVERPLAQVPNH
jgi:hypothetical protein